MTIKETEEKYFNQMLEFEKLYAEKNKRNKIIFLVISLVFLIAGLIMTVKAYTTPKEVITYESGYSYERESTSIIFMKIFSLPLAIIGVSLLSISLFAKKLVNQDIEVLEKLEIKRQLYLNYLRCEDITEKDKEYCKQMLEEIRYAKMVNAISRAGSAVSSSVLLSTIHRG